jgi:hypothetical protein
MKMETEAAMLNALNFEPSARAIERQMAMISRRKYWDATAAQKHSEAAEPVFGDTLYRFCSALLEAIHGEVLTVDGCDAFRRRWSELTDSLRPDWQPEDGSAAEDTARRIISEYRTAVQLSAAQQAIEIQQIFAIVNQALIVMSEGKDRTVSRLNGIQESLHRASMINDIVPPQSSLIATVDFINEEAAQAQEVTSREITQFSTELNPGRPEWSR